MRACSSGGFDSLTAKTDLADRICEIGKPAVILHVGGYDPSGVSIFDGVAADVAAVVKADRPWATVDATFERIALAAEQVWEHDLATAPPKAADTRPKTWYGGTCQFEALPPNLIADTVRAGIERPLDHKLLALDAEIEQHERHLISDLLPALERKQ